MQFNNLIENLYDYLFGYNLLVQIRTNQFQITNFSFSSILIIKDIHKVLIFYFVETTSICQQWNKSMVKIFFEDFNMCMKIDYNLKFTVASNLVLVSLIIIIKLKEEIKMLLSLKQQVRKF